MPSRYQFFMGGLDSLLTTLQTNAAEFYEWWTSIDTTYRATGCLLTSFFLNVGSYQGDFRGPGSQVLRDRNCRARSAWLWRSAVHARDR